MLRNRLKTLVDIGKKQIASFNRMTTDQKKAALQKIIREHTVLCILFAVTAAIAGGSIALPRQGRIIAMGPEMQQAFELLNSTETGKKLIKKASLSTKGTPVFLVRGTTEENDLKDFKGETVLGMTRACFKSTCSRYTPTGIFIYSNKDLSGPRLEIIALTLAFEFENVIYAMHYPAIEYATDSPESEKSLEKVALELGLIESL